MAVAFELREEYAGNHLDAEGEDTGTPIYAGGVVGLPPDGRSWHVGQALDEGDGVIVVEEGSPEHGWLAGAQGAESFKPTSVPEDHPAVAGLDSLPKAELVRRVEAQGIASAGKYRKEELVAILSGEAIDEADEGPDTDSGDDD